MKFNELVIRKLTQEQLQLKDNHALTLAKKNCVALVKGMNLKEMPKFPKPVIIDDNLLSSIQDRLYYDVTWDSSSLVQIICYMMELDGTNWVVNIQRVSNIAYCFACSNILIVSEASRGYWDNIESLLRWRLKTKDMDTPTDNCFSFEVMAPVEVKADAAKMTARDLKLPSVNAGSDFPADLAEHFLQFNSVEDIIREACRIQMLGPKYKRAENALNALFETWKTMDK